MATSEQLYDLIHDDVAAAMKEPDHSLRITLLSTIGATAFAVAYEGVPGDPKGVDQASIDFINVLRAAMIHTIPDGTDEQVDRVTQVWATAAANAAVYYSDPKGTKRWITRLDDRVRDQHRPMHGVTVGAGQTFTVDGWPLRYPGEPVGPPEIWMNCRCNLDHSTVAAGGGMSDRPSNAPETPTETPDLWLAHNDSSTITNDSSTITILAASDKPWGQFSASDYTIEQWRRACILTMPGGDPESKSTYKLPIREPGGALNVNGVHAAASRFGSTHAPAEAKASAKAKLRGAYKQIGEQPPDSLKAAGEDDTLVAWPKSTSPPGTHDAPGWVTNPKETQRLRNYWVKGAGAAKIAWGTPGDLTRCEKYLVKYVGPAHSWGTCQNLHKEALGIWNPESAGRRAGADFDMITEAFAAAAALEDTMDTDTPTTLAPPLEWFEDPGFDAPTPLTITADGRVLGHLASWDTCHVGITGECVTPPRSQTNYAHFRTGEVETAEGQLVAVGAITMDTGHASPSDGPQVAASHYDDTGTGVADVSAGEDDHGIWVAGAMRPGVSDQQLYVLKATGALSGDWRRIGGNLELVAALAVNVPGFPVPRVEMAASAGRTLSLVAAAVVRVDPNALDADRVAVAVLARLDQREADRRRAERFTKLRTEITALRVEALAAAVR